MTAMCILSWLVQTQKPLLVYYTPGKVQVLLLPNNIVLHGATRYVEQQSSLVNKNSPKNQT